MRGSHLAEEVEVAAAALMPDALEASIEDVMPHLDTIGMEMAANLRKLVLMMTRKSVSRIFGKCPA